MGDPDAPELDQAELVRTLTDHGVRFVLVGGAGANAHGSERLTTDLDIVPEWTTENLDRLAEALAELGARLRVAGMPDGIEAPLDARMLVAMELSTWRTRAGDFDVISRLPHGKRTFVLYGELASRAVHTVLFGFPVDVAALDDIIISKETVDRPADRQALPELRELRSKGQG
jgi:predicted nucleotidyltransferase